MKMQSKEKKKYSFGEWLARILFQYWKSDDFIRLPIGN